ncbi:Methyltransferase domain-containing protein [Spirosomataceae bacterium TFI 002]|nr:Methyltransferase domain-containing protein [Spirosomataceae bacterium TFI 002]
MHTETIKTEEDFKKLVTADLQYLNAVHWTPIEVIDQILFWLKDYDALKILDIGSGVGKFCLIGGQKSHHHFTGIEKRTDFHDEGQKLLKALNLPNVSLLQADIVTFNLTAYDVIYLFNPFYEQVVNHGTRINDTAYQKENYLKYESYVLGHLINSVAGKMVISYEYNLMQKAKGFVLLHEAFDGALGLWRKR